MIYLLGGRPGRPRAASRTPRVLGQGAPPAQFHDIYIYTSLSLSTYVYTYIHIHIHIHIYIYIHIYIHICIVIFIYLIRSWILSMSPFAMYCASWLSAAGMAGINEIARHIGLIQPVQILRIHKLRISESKFLRTSQWTWEFQPWK